MRKFFPVSPCRSHFVLILLTSCFVSSGFSSVQAALIGQNTSPAAMTRACSANPVLGTSGKNKAARKTKHPPPPEPPPACLEVKGEALEIQEILQIAVRDLKWRVHENHASEDTWTFVRYLSVEELEKYADTKVLLEPVEFRPDSVLMEVSGKQQAIPNDFAWIFAGGEPPTAFLKKIGVGFVNRDITTEGSREAKEAKQGVLATA
jgi:hypothetical protein